jgi:hypothetical protein
MNLQALVRKPLVWGVAAAVVLAATLGAWGWSKYRVTSLRQAVAPQVQAAHQRLRAALEQELEPDAAQGEQIAARLDAAAQDIEARLAALRALDAAPDPERVAAAEETLDDAAAIVRRQAAVVRAGLAFAAARAALRAHMRGARARSRSWLGEAIELKHKMERAFLDYKYALDGLDARLGDVPDRELAAQARKRVATALEHAETQRAASRRF